MAWFVLPTLTHWIAIYPAFEQLESGYQFWRFSESRVSFDTQHFRRFLITLHDINLSLCYNLFLPQCVTTAVGYHGRFHRFIQRNVLHKWRQQDSACEVCVYNVAWGLNFCENVFLRIVLKTPQKSKLQPPKRFLALRYAWLNCSLEILSRCMWYVMCPLYRNSNADGAKCKSFLSNSLTYDFRI